MSSIADILLDALTDEEFATYSADTTTEEHIVIGADRFITVPANLKRIAVQFDHDVETVTFDCPRYWDEHDMSKMKVYINYMRSDGVTGMYWAEEVTVDETDDSIMHFNWTISNNVTVVKGDLRFLVCIKKTDESGNEKNHWNSELCKDMHVSEGMECDETILTEYPDIITQLLTRMDYVEEIATPEHMQDYVNEYFNDNPEMQETIVNILYEYMSTKYPTTEEAMHEYIRAYLDKHPPLFVVGPEKPGVSCLWFNTGTEAASLTHNTVLKLTADSVEDTIYAEIEDDGTTVYDFDIL